MTIRTIINYNPKTGEIIKKKNNKPIHIYYLSGVPYTSIGGKNVNVYSMVWEYMYGEVEKGVKFHTINNDPNDFRLFNIIHPYKLNYLAAKKIYRYMNRLARKEKGVHNPKTFSDF
jgi:hypothetical protein